MCKANTGIYNGMETQNTERKKEKNIGPKIIASKIGKNMSMVCRTENINLFNI